MCLWLRCEGKFRLNGSPATKACSVRCNSSAPCWTDSISNVCWHSSQTEISPSPASPLVNFVFDEFRGRGVSGSSRAQTNTASSASSSKNNLRQRNKKSENRRSSIRYAYGIPQLHYGLIWKVAIETPARVWCTIIYLDIWVKQTQNVKLKIVFSM